MKPILRGALCAILAAVLLFSLVSCAGTIKDEDAKNLVETFFDSLEVQDYARARECLHPESKIDVDSFVESAKEVNGIVFSAGVSVESITVTKNTVYSGSEQSTHKILSVTLLAESTERQAEIHLLKNGTGFGIYTVTLLGGQA